MSEKRERIADAVVAGIIALMIGCAVALWGHSYRQMQRWEETPEGTDIGLYEPARTELNDNHKNKRQ